MRKNAAGEFMDIETLIKSGQSVQLYPQGYSMYPLLVPGRDEVILSPLPARPLRRGEVVLYRRDAGILVLHRICRCRKDAYYMVGDNQVKVEGPLREDQMIGIMTGFVRKGKLFSTEDIRYRILSRIWLVMRPVRRCITVPGAKVKKLVRKLLHK